MRGTCTVVSSFVTEGSVNYDAKMCHQGLTVDCITNALCQMLGEHTTQERMAIHDDIPNQFKVIQEWTWTTSPCCFPSFHLLGEAS